MVNMGPRGKNVQHVKQGLYTKYTQQYKYLSIGAVGWMLPLWPQMIRPPMGEMVLNNLETCLQMSITNLKNVEPSGAVLPILNNKNNTNPYNGNSYPEIHCELKTVIRTHARTHTHTHTHTHNRLFVLHIFPRSLPCSRMARLPSSRGDVCLPVGLLLLLFHLLLLLLLLLWH